MSKEDKDAEFFSTTILFSGNSRFLSRKKRAREKEQPIDRRQERQ